MKNVIDKQFIKEIAALCEDPQKEEPEEKKNRRPFYRKGELRRGAWNKIKSLAKSGVRVLKTTADKTKVHK